MQKKSQIEETQVYRIVIEEIGDFIENPLVFRIILQGYFLYRKLEFYRKMNEN